METATIEKLSTPKQVLDESGKISLTLMVGGLGESGLPRVGCDMGQIRGCDGRGCYDDKTGAYRFALDMPQTENINYIVCKRKAVHFRDITFYRRDS